LTHDAPRRDRAATAPAKRREHARLVIGLVLGAVATAFALLNTGDVKVNWIFGSAQTPLIVVIVVSLVAGVLLDRIVAVVRRRRRK